MSLPFPLAVASKFLAPRIDHRGPFGRLARAFNQQLDLNYYAAIHRHEEKAHEALRRRWAVVQNLKVSIVTPTYGIDLHYIKEWVHSIQRQSYPYWELCIVDDGDPDPSVFAYLQGLARKDPARFKIDRLTSNQGIAIATRRAMELASGDVLLFSDADDLLHKDAVELFVRAFSHCPDTDLVYSDMDHCCEQGFRTRPMRKPGWSPELLLFRNYINHLVGVRASLLESCKHEIFARETSGAQDWDFCFRAAQVSRKVVHIPALLYHWRLRPGSIAADGMAKPWALSAGKHVLSTHYQCIDPRLTLDALGSEYGGPDIRQDAEHPSVLVVGNGRESLPLDYSGDVSTVQWEWDASTAYNPTTRLTELLRHSQAEVVWLLDHPERFTGRLSKLVAFAIQPHVGCVWPFKGPRARRAYTIERDSSKLVPDQASGVFGTATGNVLTGPIEGLMIKRTLLLELLERYRELSLDGTQMLDIGPTIGLLALLHSTRNVAVSCCYLDHEFPLGPLVPQNLLPPYDPYQPW